MFDEEDSKKARIFQREKRHELQLIIDRCNSIAFEYVCLPKTRSENDLCFGSTRPRTTDFYSDSKSLNSYMRRCLKEFFPEQHQKVEKEKKSDDEGQIEEIGTRPSGPFASKVPRFQEIAIDSTGVRRRRKTKESSTVAVSLHSAFGSSNRRDCIITRPQTINPNSPGVGLYNIINKQKQLNCHHSFGGDVKIESAYQIVCGPVNLDNKCHFCEDEPKNVYWKNRKTGEVLCRSCYNQTIFNIRNKSRGVIERFRKMHMMENDFGKKRYCDFYHNHNKTTAAIRLMTPKEFHKRIEHENHLSTLFNY